MGAKAPTFGGNPIPREEMHAHAENALSLPERDILGVEFFDFVGSGSRGCRESLDIHFDKRLG